MSQYQPDTAEFWQQAVSYAARKHRDQLRKDRQTPYVAHPYRVAMTVRHVFGCDDGIALAAALLHDVIEDTTTDYDALARRFGDELATVVATVSKDPRLPEPRREQAFYAQIAAGPWRAQLVKLADGYDNLSDAPDAKMLDRALTAAQHALEAAGDDEQLVDAKRALSELIASKRA